MTIRCDSLPASLRTRLLYRALRAATITVAKTQKCRIVHASIQSNHIHLICEAADQYLLAKCMQGFQIAAAKHINRALDRHGTVFRDRYHTHVLRSPRETKNAVRYVLENFRHHGVHTDEPLDPFASAYQVPGWSLTVWWPECFLLRKAADGPPTP